MLSYLNYLLKSKNGCIFSNMNILERWVRIQPNQCVYTIVCQNLLCTNRKQSPPNHFIGAASSNKVKASIYSLLFALEIHLCDFKLLLAEFKKCKGVLLAFLHFTFLKQFKPVKDDSTHLNYTKQLHKIPFDKQGYNFFFLFFGKI
jgi:hypothetical protein